MVFFLKVLAFFLETTNIWKKSWNCCGSCWGSGCIPGVVVAGLCWVWAVLILWDGLQYLLELGIFPKILTLLLSRRLLVLYKTRILFSFILQRNVNEFGETRKGTSLQHISSIKCILLYLYLHWSFWKRQSIRALIFLEQAITWAMICLKASIPEH